MFLVFGADYYPEHWPEERWVEDIDLMSKAGFNTVRLAEFAWSKLEPKRGEYNFEWLDKAVDMLGKKGIKTIIGTPTAAPPPWIIKAHPDILRIDGNGKRAAEGTRKNYCANNPNCIEHSKRIVEKMALHYGDNPNVIGWQTDNEFGCHSSELCYCPNCITAFRDWLRKKYKTLEKLNEACGLIFWGQEYGNWDQIFPPRPPFTMQSPSLNLEWRRFASDSWVKYQQIQIDIIRKHAPHQLITHNLMGLYKELDYFKLTEPLDLVSFDYYPKWAAQVDFSASAMSHDIMRSLKKKPYWIMELQSGAVKTQAAPTPKPGEIRLWTIQSVARGADGTIYFRWRTCRFGAEEYWHGILDHDGIPRRRYSEVKKVSEELHEAAPYIEGTSVNPQVAFTLVYDNIWALDLEVGYEGKNYYGIHSWRPALDFYSALYARNVLVDFVNPILEDMSRYKAVFVPSMMLVDGKVEENLKSYVKGGGILVATLRTGAKDWNNNVVEESLPGRLSNLFGMTVEEYTGLPSDMKIEFRTTKAELGAEKTCAGVGWAEMLHPKEARVAAYYQTGIYKNKPAATVNSFGEGAAFYLGTFADKEFCSALVDWLIRKRKIEKVLPSALGLEATKRSGPDNEIIFALNHSDKAVEVPCNGREYEDLINGEKVTQSLTVGGIDVRILRTLE